MKIIFKCECGWWGTDCDTDQQTNESCNHITEHHCPSCGQLEPHEEVLTDKEFDNL